MKRYLAVALMSLLAASHAYADWDPELEAREQRAREAEARKEAARQAENKRLKDEANAKFNTAQMADKRKYVGAEAAGKSDAEVNRLYDAKVAAMTAEANSAMAEGRRKLNSPQGKAATKEVTGYTMEEMSNMSDAELDALAKEMERKYGGGN